MVKLKPKPAEELPAEPQKIETEVVYHVGVYSRSAMTDIRHDDKLKKWVGYAQIEAFRPSAGNGEEPPFDAEVGMVSEGSRHLLIDAGKRWCVDAWNRKIKQIEESNWDGTDTWATSIVDAARILDGIEVPKEIRGMVDEYAMYPQQGEPEVDAPETRPGSPVPTEPVSEESERVLAAAASVGRVAIDRARAKVRLTAARREYDEANRRLDEALESLEDAVSSSSPQVVEETAGEVAAALAAADGSVDGSIEVLDIPKGLKQILVDAGLKMVSDIGQWTASGKKLTEIPKVGQSKADRLAEALESFWKSNR